MSNSVSLSTPDFTHLFNLTNAISPIPDLSFDKLEPKNRWLVLSKIWYRQSADFGTTDILADALLYTVDCAFFKNFTPAQKTLIASIADLLKSDSEASQYWRSSARWSRTLKKALPQTNCSYDKYREFFTAYYRYVIVNTINLGTSSYARQLANDISTDLKIIQQYTTIIHTLLPESQNWDDHRWLNVSIAIDDIKAKYNLDFSDNTIGDRFGKRDDNAYFNNLLNICDYTLNQKTPVPPVLMFYNGINLPIARVLWGNHADTVLFRAYEEFSAEYISERAEGLPYSPIAATLLQQSWLSNLVHEWIYDKDAVYHDQSRELVFNLEMTGGLN